MYLPIATTLVAVVFFCGLARRSLQKRTGPHLAWWAAGIFTFGAGTFLESLIALLGNSIWLNKTWYVMGALLGVYPLGQGTAYLLCSRRTANRLTFVTLPFVAVLAILVFASPVVIEQLHPEKPSGAILAWTWLRAMTPIINLYAAAFLIGGAVWSSWRYFASGVMKNRAVGNAVIALGAILPGIGGAAAKTGRVEVLYITEFIGLVLIWLGYLICLRPETAPAKDSGG
jgi:hypothetical protein